MGFWPWSWFGGSSSSSPSKPVETCYNIEGFLECAYFTAALKLGDDLSAENDKALSYQPPSPSNTNPPPPPNENLRKEKIKITANAFMRNDFKGRLEELEKDIPAVKKHYTSPLVLSGCTPKEYKYVGGYTEFRRLAASKYGMNDV